MGSELGGSDRNRRALGTVVPRFALAEPESSTVGARLAASGWPPETRATDLAAFEFQALARAEVLVVVCSERQLLTPAFQANLERFAPRLPRVAIVAGADPEAAAYAARLGWHGFISADRATSAIARVIVAASRGQLSFPATATSALVRALSRVAPVGGFPAAALTPRQRQIVTLIAQGATDADIATVLRISRSTAHKHVQNARRRLGAKTRSHLVATSRDLTAAEADRLALPGSLAS